MQTLKDIDTAFRNIVDEHETLQTFYTHNVKQIDIDKLTVDKYPFLYAECTQATIEAGVTEFTYDIIVGDLVIEEQTDTLTDVYAEAMLILSDVIAMFELAISDSNNNVTDDRWNFELPVTAQPYSSRFDNLLTGWSCQFVLRVPNAVNLCDALYK
ncbi:MAG: hypothetical protein Unbinned1446contig1005_22 [Prokaryotic dsDNA virus sp.]|nr:MAG: hypothetical protein Unbinned1446contig1005_22 [Prokaryotic dsDNA virus sp.]|tara:strand:+ start:1939 stop:2406 length:468 start_codon:yes stop_codon:yes gene_type:complete